MEETAISKASQLAEIQELRGSRRRLVEAASADRKALERALHDGVQQHLVALSVDLQRLAGLIDARPAAAHELLVEIRANLRDAMAEATALAEALYPPLLEGRGLVAAIRSVADRVGVTVKADVPSRASGGDGADVGAAVYWSCVEALASAPAGSHATVSVREADGGIAFEVSVAGPQPGARIERLRDRIEALDGRLIVTEDEAGSGIQGWLPPSR